MATYSEPVIGDWYINMDGQFIRTWGCVYEHGRLNGVVIQPLNGGRYYISLTRWRDLKPVRYAATREARSEVVLS